MTIERINFPPVIPDNETTYLNYIEGLISSIDENSSMLMSRGINGLSIRIAPSEYRYFEEILKVIKRFHTMLGIQVEFSKSMKAGMNITFNIKFEDQ